MIVDPIKMVNGVDDSTGYSIAVSAKTIRGYQGNPFVKTEDQTLKRETYEMQMMIDPGDPEKKRELYHMFHGTYEFTSDVYANIPEGHVGILVVNEEFLAAGCSISMQILEPGYKGLIVGQLNVAGGEVFVQPGMDVAELIVMQVGK